MARCLNKTFSRMSNSLTDIFLDRVSSVSRGLRVGEQHLIRLEGYHLVCVRIHGDRHASHARARLATECLRDRHGAIRDLAEVNKNVVVGMAGMDIDGLRIRCDRSGVDERDIATFILDRRRGRRKREAVGFFVFSASEEKEYSNQRIFSAKRFWFHVYP